MSNENERPPPLHTRVLTTLRDAFFPAVFREWIREERDLWRQVSAEVDAEREAYYRAHPESHAARRAEQRRILREFDQNPEAFPGFELTRRVWEAGKPRKPSPPPSLPTNE